MAPAYGFVIHCPWRKAESWLTMGGASKEISQSALSLCARPRLTVQDACAVLESSQSMTGAMRAAPPECAHVLLARGISPALYMPGLMSRRPFVARCWMLDCTIADHLYKARSTGLQGLIARTRAIIPSSPVSSTVSSSKCRSHTARVVCTGEMHSRSHCVTGPGPGPHLSTYSADLLLSGHSLEAEGTLQGEQSGN